VSFAYLASDLLKAADSIDAQRLWLRSSLLRLHAMAHHVIDVLGKLASSE
jgi:hypothetical protein